MSFGSFQDQVKSALIVESFAESQATGLKVGRLEIWPVGLMSGEQSREAILSSKFDLVVVRYPAADFEFAQGLTSPLLQSLQADTLMYYEFRDCRDINAQERVDLQLRELSEGDVSILDSLIPRVFGGYKNHYSSNPLFESIDVTDAYLRWTNSCLNQRNISVLIASEPRLGEVGICVLDEISPDYAEILLAGIVSEARRQGIYSDMIRKILARVSLRESGTVVISTQAANIEVTRAWCRLGFLPIRALNTVHVWKV